MQVVNMVCRGESERYSLSSFEMVRLNQSDIMMALSEQERLQSLCLRRTAVGHHLSDTHRYQWGDA